MYIIENPSTNRVELTGLAKFSLPLGILTNMSIRAQKSHGTNQLNLRGGAGKKLVGSALAVTTAVSTVIGLAACSPSGRHQAQSDSPATGNEAEISRAARAEGVAQPEHKSQQVNVADYTVKDSSLPAGRTAIRFATPDRKINCEYQADRFACITKPQGHWPPEVRKQGFEPTEPQTVGWWPGQLDGKVQTWVTQGAWPRVSPETKVLPESQTIVMDALDGQQQRVTCTNRANTLNCSNGKTGFTLGDQGLNIS